MEIKRKKQQIEFEHMVAPFLCEGEVEVKYQSSDNELNYTRRLQAVAALDVSLLIKGDGQLDLPTTQNEQYANVYVSEALGPNGIWDHAKLDGLRKIGVHPNNSVNVSGKDHDALSLEIMIKMKEALPNYTSYMNVRVHSAQFQHEIGVNHETALARPYINQIVDRALEDARQLLYGGRK